MGYCVLFYAFIAIPLITHARVLHSNNLETREDQLCAAFFDIVSEKVGKGEFMFFHSPFHCPLIYSFCICNYSAPLSFHEFLSFGIFIYIYEVLWNGEISRLFLSVTWVIRSPLWDIKTAGQE